MQYYLLLISYLDQTLNSFAHFEIWAVIFNKFFLILKYDR